MNKFIVLIFLVSASAQIGACPTCIGKITENSQVFFNEDLYACSETVNCDEFYEMITLNEQKEEV